MTEFLAIFLLLMLGGWMVAATAYAQPGARTGATLRAALPWAPGLAFGLLSALWFMGLDLFGRPPTALFVAGSLLLIAGLATLPVREFPPDPGSPRPRGRALAARLAFHGTLLVTLYQYFLLIDLQPAGGFDAMAIWNYAARFLARAGADYRHLIPDLAPAHHMDYPLMLPASVAAFWGLAGQEGYGAQHLIQLGFLVGLPLMMRQILRGFVGTGRADLGGAVVAALPGVLFWSSRQYADVALAYFVLAAAGGLASRLAARAIERPPLLLTGFMLAGALWTKNEGVPLVALMLAIYFPMRLRGASLRVCSREALRLGLGAAPLLLPIVLFKAGWAPRNDLIVGMKGRLPDFIADPERWRVVAAAFVGEFDVRRLQSFFEWGAAWPLAITLVLIGLVGRRFRLSRHELFLGVLSLGAICGWFLVYVVTPQKQQWHLDTSLSRLLVQILPTILLFAIVVATDRSRPRPQETTLP